MLRTRKLARGPGKLRLSLRGILLGALVLLSLASSLWTLRRALGADRAPELVNGARALRSLTPNTCAHRACRRGSCDSVNQCSAAWNRQRTGLYGYEPSESGSVQQPVLAVGAVHASLQNSLCGASNIPA